MKLNGLSRVVALSLACTVVLALAPATALAHAKTPAKAPVKTSLKVAKPAAPAGLKAKAEGLTTVSLSWKAVKGATGYELYRATAKKGPYTLVQTISAAKATDSGLTAGKTYYYKLKTVGKPGVRSAWGTAAAVTMKLAAPTGLKATTAGLTSVKLAWNAVTDATGYEVYRAGPNGVFKKVCFRKVAHRKAAFQQVTVTADTTWTDTLVAPGTFTYKVKATYSDPKANSSYSASRTVMPRLTAPEGIAAAVDDNANSVRLAWTPVDEASGYTVYRSTSANGPFMKVGATTTAVYTDTGLKGGKTYYYKVAATHANKGYNSLLSKAAKATLAADKTTAAKTAPIKAKSKVCQLHGGKCQAVLV